MRSCATEIVDLQRRLNIADTTLQDINDNGFSERDWRAANKALAQIR
jgi:hypothetical protein